MKSITILLLLSCLLLYGCASSYVKKDLEYSDVNVFRSDDFECKNYADAKYYRYVHSSNGFVNKIASLTEPPLFIFGRDVYHDAYKSCMYLKGYIEK